MPDKKYPMPDPASELNLKRRLVGIVLLPISLFPLLALLTYDWRAMSFYMVPPHPSSNLIGMAGDVFAFSGYQLVGLTVWAVPFLCLFVSISFLTGRAFFFTRRTLGLFVFFFASTCLLQLLAPLAPIKYVLRQVNIEPNAGGALGYLVMTRALAHVLSPFGAGILMALLAFLALCFTVGFRNILRGLSALTAWAAARQPDHADKEDPDLADQEHTRAMLAIKKAQEDAIAQRKQEKQEIVTGRKKNVRDFSALPKEDPTPSLWAPASPAPVPPAPLSAPPVQPPPPPAPPPPPPPAAPVSSAPAAPAPANPAISEDRGPYVLPPPDQVLNPLQPNLAEHGDVEAMEKRLIDTLAVFHVDVQPAFRVTGPVVTQYALTLAPGVKPERISALSASLQMALEAKSLRIQAPIPGKNAVGIEVPNQKPASVCFREIFDSQLWQQKAMTGKFHVPLLLGKDAAGNDLAVDLSAMPHLLVAGATGKGKSVCLNAIINGLLMSRTPEELKFIMVDPKRVEFTQYNKLPHLLIPVINDTKKVVFGLRWAVVEMEKRLKMFSRAGCRNIVDFNTRPSVSQPDFFGGDETVSDPDMPRKIPYIVIVIDEVADIMQTSGKDVEPVISRLTALARATGIHLILATQRPDAKIITGVIKSNIPGRIAFKTSSAIDSRTILDDMGAEDLIGRGDMLYKTSDGILLRAQGAFISDEEINRITSFISEHASVQFDEKLLARISKIKEADPSDALDDPDADEANEANPPGDASADEPRAAFGKEDKNYAAAIEIIARTGRASISFFQRRMNIGYNPAARIMEMLEERGIVGPPRAGGSREILLDPETLAKIAQGELSGQPPLAQDAAAGLDGPFSDPQMALSEEAESEPFDTNQETP